jgi:hypothetical protein
MQDGRKEMTAGQESTEANLEKVGKNSWEKEV